MRGLAAIIASAENSSDRNKKQVVAQPLKIVASPNDVLVYYEDYVRVYHAEGEGMERHNISSAVYNLSTTVSGTADRPDFILPEQPAEDILKAAEDPYYIHYGGD